ncbi:hypothetical protein K501DRAFT_287682 [Backusella circina FSU 941]|nr:hypothetical protein K501DRAFT_287682 [Backusella circina FSU 941]
MPRNYYCDFCQCSFPDNATNRRNHDQGAIHLSNRKLHYDWFKDPDDFLQEQLNKSPCRHYLTQGFCDYGLTCKYSHITVDHGSGNTIYPPELIQWFEAQKKQVGAQMTQKIKSQESKKRYKLPTGWKVKDLPPSLKPPPSKHGYDWTDDVGFWG